MVESRGKQEEAGGRGEKEKERIEKQFLLFFFVVPPRPRIAKFSHEVVEFLPMARSCNASLLIGDRDFSN